MAGNHDFYKASRAVNIVVFALGIGLFGPHSSFAGDCGAYCKARQVRAICHDELTIKGLTGDRRDAAFEKCKIHPNTHKRTQELTDDTGMSLE
jgi:hypothetical protein